MAESAPPELPKRFEMVYRDAVANIMFNKGQQWVVTNYSVAACAAIVGIVRFLALPTAPAKCVLSMARWSYRLEASICCSSHRSAWLAIARAYNGFILAISLTKNGGRSSWEAIRRSG